MRPAPRSFVLLSWLFRLSACATDRVDCAYIQLSAVEKLWVPMKQCAQPSASRNRGSAAVCSSRSKCSAA